MQFVYPSFLWALSLLAIPIIIHLFHFRRFRTVYFTNVRFLKEVKEETSSRSKLKNLLTLLLRMLAFTALIFAFAQPVLSPRNQLRKGRKAVSIFVDNSFSMQAKEDGVQLLSKAKELAGQVVNAFGESDLFQILTHDLEGRHQILVHKEDALSLIDEINMSPEVNTLNRVVKRQISTLNKEPDLHPSIYLISDFQKSIIQGPLLPDTNVQMTLLPLQSEVTNNLSIDSAWFATPVQFANQTNTLFIKVSNRGEKEVDNVRLSLVMNGEERPINTLQIQGKSHVIDTFNFRVSQTGWQDAALKITDFPIQFDDTYFISFNIPNSIAALTISEGPSNAYLQAFYKGIDGFDLTHMNVQTINYAGMARYDQIVLEDLRSISTGMGNELKKYISNGGNVLLFPAVESDLESYNRFLATIHAGRFSRGQKQEKKVGKINDKEFIFSNVFSRKTRTMRLPETNTDYSFTASTNAFHEKIMRYRDNSAYLTKMNYGNGRIYICAAPLDIDHNDLVKNAEIFVPFMYKMALSKSRQAKITHTIGRDEVVGINDKSENDQEEVFHLTKTGIDIIPGQFNNKNHTRIELQGLIREAGIYNIELADSVYGKFAFNYSRLESEIEVVDKAILKNNYSVLDEIEQRDVSTFIAENESGKPLWKLILIIALICLALEEIILRFWKL